MNRMAFGLFLLLGVAAYSIAASAQAQDQSSIFTKDSPRKVGETSKPAVIVEQPAVEYAKEAGPKDIDGVVILSLDLSSTGQVQNINIIHGLSEGQNNAAIRAARKIKFMPAVKNGEPISQSLTVEYPFRFLIIETGSIYELRSLTRVYVDTGVNIEEQRNITGEVLKELPQLKFVDSVEEADIILAFSASQGSKSDTHVEKNVWSGEKIREWNVRVDMEIGDGQVAACVFVEAEFNLEIS